MFQRLGIRGEDRGREEVETKDKENKTLPSRRHETEKEEIGRTTDGRRTKALLFSYEHRGRPSLVESKIKGEGIERRGTDGRKRGEDR